MRVPRIPKGNSGWDTFLQRVCNFVGYSSWWAKIGGGIDHCPTLCFHLICIPFTQHFSTLENLFWQIKASWLPRRSRKFMQFPTSVFGQPHSTSSNGDIYRIILRKPQRTAAHQKSGDFRKQKQNIEMNLWMYETLYYSYMDIIGYLYRSQDSVFFWPIDTDVKVGLPSSWCWRVSSRLWSM